MTMTSSNVAERLAAVRASVPLVQCLTNSVAMNFTANALLAAGAVPAMVDIPDEAGSFAQSASAVLVNLGTPYAERRSAMRVAALAAQRANVPWVIDPVAVGALPVRTALAIELLAHGPAAIRGNPSEILVLAGAGQGGRGVDATDSAEDALDAAHLLATRHHCVVAVSGPTDIITDGTADIRIGNGDKLLTLVTGGGCALGALIAAFLAAGRSNPLHAVAAATATYTIAAEVAAASASGPGSFAVNLLDALHGLDAATIDARLVVA